MVQRTVFAYEDNIRYNSVPWERKVKEKAWTTNRMCMDIRCDMLPVNARETLGFDLCL